MKRQRRTSLERAKSNLAQVMAVVRSGRVARNSGTEAGIPPRVAAQGKNVNHFSLDIANLGQR